MLGYWEWLDGLERGLAAHHAGMLPAFKEVVEELFVRGLVKAVFATETLALGINMPARCVVLERLVKFNGEAHVDLTPGEYTQLTGRAGRRGIDVEGHAVVVWSPEVDPRHVAGLASTRTYPLRSSFRPSYNMAVNLVGTVGAEPRPRAAGVVVRPVPGGPLGGRPGPAGAAQRRDHGGVRRRGAAATTATSTSTSRSGWRIADRERALARQGAAQRRAAAVDVAGAAAGRRRDPGAVRAAGPVWPWCSTPAPAGFGEPRPLVLTEDRWAGRITAGRLHRAGRGAGPGPRAQALQPPLARRSGATWPRRCGSAAWTGTAAAGGRPRPRRRRRGRASSRSCAAQLRRHPCHACPEREEHARWAERRARLERDTEALRDKVASRTGSLARTFDRVCALLAERGYLSPTARSPTPAGCCRGSGPRPTCWSPSACAAASGTAWPRPSWPRRCRWWSTRPAGRATSAPSVPRGPVSRRGRRDGEAVGRAGGRRGRARAAADPRARPRLRLADLPLGPRRAAGQGAGQRPQLEATCRPATSSAGRGRCSTCSASSPTPPGAASSSLRDAARAAMDAVNRGVLAYTAVG